MTESEKVAHEAANALEKLQNIDISKINFSGLFDKILEWSATGLFKLTVGFLIISIGFKIIKK